MEKELISRVKEALPAKEDKPQEKKRSACLTLFLGFFLGLLILFTLLLAGVALAVSATGLVEVPVLSRVFKAPEIEEDFSYEPVSQGQLEAKSAVLEESEGPVSLTLTDGELNSVLAAQFSQAQGTGTVKNILVKFDPGVIKIAGVLSRNDAPFYLELHIEKTADSFEFSIQEARLGALPIPGFIIEGLIGQILLGIDQPLGQPTAGSLPAQEIIVGDGTITLNGLDLGNLFGPEE